MNPFYFAPRERALFGVYHPPGRRRASYRGAVLCYPFGVEYMRAHRAFRQLTNLLVRAGVHVLRFDYYGTGDSAGSGREASLAQWRTDVQEAVMELRETAGLSEVTLIGLRLGAAVAMEAARKRHDVDRLIAWDPVVSGASYLEELLAHLPSAARQGEATCVSGFPLSGSLSEELRGLDLATCPSVGPARVHLVVSGENPAFLRLREHLGEQGRLEGYHVVPSEGSWSDADPFGSVVLPGAIVQEIVQVVTEGSGG